MAAANPDAACLTRSSTCAEKLYCPWASSSSTTADGATTPPEECAGVGLQLDIALPAGVGAIEESGITGNVSLLVVPSA
eukprot:scaffold26835_cov31-Tisochrysis_lutea.AAC.2